MYHAVVVRITSRAVAANIANFRQTNTCNTINFRKNVCARLIKVLICGRGRKVTTPPHLFDVAVDGTTRVC